MTARKNRMPTAKDATAKSPVRIYFADYFNVKPSVLGAFNVSLIRTPDLLASQSRVVEFTHCRLAGPSQDEDAFSRRTGAIFIHGSDQATLV